MTMQFNLITLFPQFFDCLDYGIISRAIKQNIISVNTINPRSYAQNKTNRVDDRPFGGGPGMVMCYQPLADSIQHAQAISSNKHRVIYLSPQGKSLSQPDFKNLSEQKITLTMICGRYEGIDQRIIEDYVDEEWSLGDYVLSGGEIAAATIIDATTRLLPGVVSNQLSTQLESFHGGQLEHPHYTRPVEINGKKVPDVLINGNHKEISSFRHEQSLKNTWQKRPDLLKRRILTEKEKALLAKFR